MATPDEVEQIIERMATAPFDQRLVRVPLDERGAMYQGDALGARANALTYHVIKRVVIEPQWVYGTTAAQYMHDLRRAVRTPSARLIVYTRRGGNLAATITPTETVMPAERRGPETLPQLLVIYAADRGTLITGYQFSRLEMTGVPEELQWLT